NLRYGTIALYLFVVPIALGLLGFALFRRLGRRETRIVVTLVAGTLLFLLIQTLGASLDTVSKATGVFGGASLVFLAVVLTILALLVPQISRERWAAQRPGKSHQPQLAAEDEDKEDDEDDEDDEELDASQETRPASVLGIGLRVGLRNLALSLAIGTAFAL